jgi:hypothetical protein
VPALVKSVPEPGEANFNCVDVEVFVQLPFETLADVNAVADTLLSTKPGGVVGIFMITDLVTLPPFPVFKILKVNGCEPAPVQTEAGDIEGAYLSLFPSVNTQLACPEVGPTAVNCNVAPNSSASDGTTHVELTFPLSSAVTVHG